MPKGVEHRLIVISTALETGVESLMPKGVEHAYLEMLVLLLLVVSNL